MPYIEVDSLLKKLETITPWRTPSYFTDVLETVRSIQTVSLEPTHGQWMMNSDRPDRIVCSVCSKGFDVWKHEAKDFRFCPGCGALMDESIENSCMGCIHLGFNNEGGAECMEHYMHRCNPNTRVLKHNTR